MTPRPPAAPLSIATWRTLPGVFQDGDVGIGVFPQGEEVLISAAALGGVAGQRVGAALPQVGKRNQTIGRGETSQ